MAEGQDFAHDTLYRALNQPLALFFELSLELCKGMGGLNRGYLFVGQLLYPGAVADVLRHSRMDVVAGVREGDQRRPQSPFLLRGRSQPDFHGKCLLHERSTL
jgi:hypothetical protein